MTDAALKDLSVPGTLRVGINLGNSLLVTGTADNGDPQGVAPDMAAALADHLGVAVQYVTFATPGEVADAGDRDEWDIGLIAVEPKRAEKITFSAAYVEIDATYLVPGDSPFQTVEDVDRPGVTIATVDRAAYDLYLTRTLQHAELRRVKGRPNAFEVFVADKLDALAGLAPALKRNAANLDGSRVLDGRYTSVQQAFGTRPANTALIPVIADFIADAKSTGLVAELIDRHGVSGKLNVAG